MKKIKIMLTAVTVLAVIGGALAFKAKKFSSFCVYKSQGNICALSSPTIYDFTLSGGEVVPLAKTVNVPADGCTTTANGQAVLPSTTPTTDCIQANIRVLGEE